jgi:hypothetical protein
LISLRFFSKGRVYRRVLHQILTANFQNDLAPSRVDRARLPPRQQQTPEIKKPRNGVEKMFSRSPQQSWRSHVAAVLMKWRREGAK